MKKIALALFLTALVASSAFAQMGVNVSVNFEQRSPFNQFTDWCATVGRGSTERQRIIDQRVAWRADHRRADWQRHHTDWHQH